MTVMPACHGWDEASVDAACCAVTTEPFVSSIVHHVHMVQASKPTPGTTLHT